MGAVCTTAAEKHTLFRVTLLVEISHTPANVTLPGSVRRKKGKKEKKRSQTRQRHTERKRDN